MDWKLKFEILFTTGCLYSTDDEPNEFNLLMDIDMISEHATIYVKCFLLIDFMPIPSKILSKKSQKRV